MLVVILVVAVVVLAAAYATWTAGRLDRLHARVDATAVSLDAHLRRRAAVAAAVAAELPPPGGPGLARLATIASETPRLGADREAAENALSRTLARLPAVAAGDGRAHDALVEASSKAVLARRFYNDAVRDALTVRERRVVRYLHLAGHAALPAYFELDESPVGIRAADSSLPA